MPKTPSVARARILAIDAGGTMTDTFVVDDRGGFTIGKAQTTPSDESAGIVASMRNAAGYTDRTAEQIGPELLATVYSGTAMLNRLLERTGAEQIGVIVTAGMEDYLQLERAVQTYAGYQYADRLHAVTHVHNEPLVPRRRIRGVRGRISFFGEEVIPLYREEAERAVSELLDAGINSLAISLLYSYRDSAHEDQIAEIARKIIAARGLDVEVYTSSAHSPVRGDLARLNTLLVELYAAKPSRANLRAIRDHLEREVGSTAPVRVVTSYGGTISPEHGTLVSTIVSGPIGGLIGADALVSHAYGGANVVCTDVGGTSFDVGLISERVVATRTEPMMARMLLALPHVAMDSIGAGTGTRIRVDRTVDRVVLGPDSAGSRIGVCWPSSGETIPSLTDCDVVLGLVNPDYFLGGEIPLDVERARAALSEHVVAPLKAESVERAALGVVGLLQTQMRDHLTGMILGMGYAPENYDLLSYGGGGPLHVAGYTKGLGFQSVRVPAWAAAFSAFGCACADYTYRYDRSVDMLVPPAGDRTAIWAALDAVWDGLQEQILSDCRRDGVALAGVTLTMSVRMQYSGMLDDLEIPVGDRTGDPAADMDRLMAEFDALFSKIFARAARSPESGYFLTKAIMVGTYATEKPVLPEFALAGEKPASSAEKGTRRIFEEAGWAEARLYEMTELQSGNVVHGPAVIEDPATTFYVPSGYRTVLDRFRVFELQRTGPR
ncbi:MAG TPA: hydantoinase/oxoprolinase family protein [Sporichthya sp.]|nr:hydantoinase/oxoprolinase family protein [Sporichthya sp.]